MLIIISVVGDIIILYNNNIQLSHNIYSDRPGNFPKGRQHLDFVLYGFICTNSISLKYFSKKVTIYSIKLSMFLDVVRFLNEPSRLCTTKWRIK